MVSGRAVDGTPAATTRPAIYTNPSLEEDMSRTDSDDRVGSLILLGSFLYTIPVVLAMVIVVGWSIYSVGGRGILRSYTLVLYSSVCLFGLLICIGLILRYRWWGVALAPALGVVSVLLIWL